VIAEPPFAPAVNATLSVYRAVAVIPLMIGALGALHVVPTFVADAVPLPTAVTARICTLYAVPLAKFTLVSLVSVSGNGDVVSTGDIAFHDDPPSVEYS
jgi:hypothetical protein